MGPTRAKDQPLTQDEATALKDAQIANLEAKLEAYSARASTAQTRLLKTIDVLDALRTQHALEISAEEQTKIKLTHEVDGWRSLAKTREVERDELKEVVEDLIEKVQISNEWSSWSCSRMHISNYAELANGGTFDVGRTNVHSNDDLLAYATSIIARLRAELDFERQSHTTAVEEANLRIEELEAKVAVREAELEGFITSDEHQGSRKDKSDDAAKHDLTKRRLGRRIPHPKAMTDEECLRFLESNNARNRSLELEIYTIAERQTRMVALAHNDLLSPASGNGKGMPAGPILRARSASVDPNVLSRPPTSATSLSIAQIDNQIRAMTAQMDALRTERITLVETATMERRATNGTNMDNFQDILRLESECVRLQAEVDDLREQLDFSRSSARLREKEFLREIARLRASSPRPASDLYHVFSPKLLEDEIVPEESMELATPLQPTVTPAPPAQDPNFSSLSFTPEHVSSPPPPDAPPLPYTNPVSQDIDRVQAALDAARAHLAEKETELVSLRAEIEKVRVQVEKKEDHRKDNG